MIYCTPGSSAPPPPQEKRIMLIMNTYFGPAELKNLYIMTSRDRQRIYRTVIRSGKLVANHQNATDYGLLWAHVHPLTFSSANYRLKYVDNHSNCDCLNPVQSASLNQVDLQAYINSQSHLNISNMS